MKDVKFAARSRPEIVCGSSHETTNQVGSMSVTGGLGVRPVVSGPWLCPGPAPRTINDAVE